MDERTLLRRAVAGAAMSLAISMFFALKWVGDAMDAEQTSWHNVAGSFLFFCAALGGALVALMVWLESGKGWSYYTARLAIAAGVALLVYLLGLEARLEEWTHSELPP